MYLAVIGNRVVHHCEGGYVCMGSNLVCDSENLVIEDATIVDIEDKEVPGDIDCGNYQYIHGEFVRVTPMEESLAAEEIPQGNFVTVDENGVLVDSGSNSEDFVNISGDTMTGNLLINRRAVNGSPAVYLQGKQGESLIQGEYFVSTNGNVVRIGRTKDGTTTNFMDLYDDRVEFGQPISGISSGGSGSTSGDYLPLAGGTVTGPIIASNGSGIASDNENVKFYMQAADYVGGESGGQLNMYSYDDGSTTSLQLRKDSIIASKKVVIEEGGIESTGSIKSKGSSYAVSAEHESGAKMIIKPLGSGAGGMLQFYDSTPAEIGRIQIQKDSTYGNEILLRGNTRIRNIDTLTVNLLRIDGSVQGTAQLSWEWSEELQKYVLCGTF